MMSSRTSALFRLSFTVLSFATLGRAIVDYANDFVDPAYILAKKFPLNTIPAQQTILAWAEEAAVGGPWSAPFRSHTTLFTHGLRCDLTCQA